MGGSSFSDCSWLGNARAAAADANAVATPRERAEDESRVRLKFVLPLWLPLLALNSSATVEGSQTEVVEAETEVSWIVIGMLDVGYRPLVARVDVFGVGFGETLSLKGGGERQIAFDGSGFVGRAILMYELGPWALNRTRTNRFLVAPLAGARYNQVKFEAAEASDLNGRYRWVDSVVGVRTEFTLGDFRLGTHIDFGGFGASSVISPFAGARTAEDFIGEAGSRSRSAASSPSGLRAGHRIAWCQEQLGLSISPGRAQSFGAEGL